MNQKQLDLIYGEHNEQLAKQIIINHWELNNLIKLDKFHHMDFETDKYYFEIKSRRFRHTKYTSTMVGFDKIEYARKSEKEVFFIFMFTDGIYYYKYDEKDSFETCMGGRLDRGRREIRNYYYIPIDKLNEIKTLN
jgi:hypothetical protein